MMPEMFIWLRSTWLPLFLLLGIATGFCTGDWCAASMLMVLSLIGALDEVVIRVADRGERPQAPQCHRCRYDLTGNISGVCPECGARIRIQR